MSDPSNDKERVPEPNPYEPSVCTRPNSPPAMYVDGPEKVVVFEHAAYSAASKAQLCDPDSLSESQADSSYSGGKTGNNGGWDRHQAQIETGYMKYSQLQRPKPEHSKQEPAKRAQTPNAGWGNADSEEKYRKQIEDGYYKYSQPQNSQQYAAGSATSVTAQQTNEEMSNSHFSRPGGTEEEPPTDYESQADSGHSGGEVVTNVNSITEEEDDRKRTLRFLDELEQEKNRRK